MSTSPKMDLEKLRAELQYWLGEAVGAIKLEKEAREEAIVLQKERDQLRQELFEECYPRIQKLLEAHKALVDNYAALLPVIKIKKQLSAEVKMLQETIEELKKTHVQEVGRLMDQSESCRVEASKKQAQIEGNAHEEASKKEAAHKEEIAMLEERLQKDQDQHNEELANLRKQMHEETEGLLNRITRLKQIQSSQATSNMDLIANKLQATREEYSKVIGEKEATIAQLQEALTRSTEDCQHYREALRHQKLLSVVRCVTPSKKQMPLSSPKTPSQENAERFEENLEEKDTADREEGELEPTPHGSDDDFSPLEVPIPKNVRFSVPEASREINNSLKKPKKLTKRRLYNLEETLEDIEHK